MAGGPPDGPSVLQALTRDVAAWAQAGDGATKVRSGFRSLGSVPFGRWSVGVHLVRRGFGS